jgi:predicted AAA+ superfamily ATPase
MKYYSRIFDETLDNYLSAFGAILITGPKWCGKTTTAIQKAKTVIKLQDPSRSEYYKKMIDLDSSRVLQGEYPILIDEWQEEPSLWDIIRNLVDEKDQVGRYILTGSVLLNTTNIKHSGIGRIAKLKMYPMSLFESKDSTGSISLKDLFDHKSDNNGLKSNLRITDLAFLICRGGWPTNINKSESRAQMLVSSYVDSICDNDMEMVDASLKNPALVRFILQSYSRNISTLASKTKIRKDIITNYEDVSLPTLYKYINVLEQLFIIEDIPAWNPNIRSKTAISKSRKLCLIDPSIAVAALNINSEYLLEDLNTFGFLFESLAIRDLKVYSSLCGGSVSYYNDRYGLECDVVLHLKDGRYGLIEVKLGSREIEKGVNNLLLLKSLIKEHKQKEPSFIMVLTGGEYAYTREDGVHIVPLGCLRP